MSNPFRFSEQKWATNRPKYDEEPPPITRQTFLQKYLPVALLNNWISCDTLQCYDVPSYNFGPYTESGEYTTGVSSNGESKILVRIPPKQYYFNANGTFYIDSDAGSGSQISINVNTGDRGCNYEHMDFICNENEFIFDRDICLSTGSTVNFNITPDQCPYVRTDLIADTSVYRFENNHALAAGSTITFAGGADLHIPLHVPLIGIMAIGTMDLCPVEYFPFNAFLNVPPEFQTLDVTNAAESYPAYMVLVEVIPDMIALRFYRNDVSFNPITLGVSDQRQFALFGIIQYDDMPDDLYIAALSVASNSRSFVHFVSLVLKENDILSENIICFPTSVCQLSYNPS